MAMPKFIKKQNGVSAPIAIALGVLSSLTITVIGMMIATQLLNTSAITENAMGILCPVVWFASSLVGCVVASALLSKQYLIACGLSSFIYFSVLFAISILFLDGNYGTIGWGILSIILGLVPALLMFLQKSGKTKTKFKYKKP